MISKILLPHITTYKKIVTTYLKDSQLHNAERKLNHPSSSPNLTLS